MESVRLPGSGTVYADTQIIVYTVEKHPTYFPLLIPFWEAVASGNVNLFTSELSVLEVLVLPLRQGDTTLVRDYETFLKRPEITLVPVSLPILRLAAQIRAGHRQMRTPDAIHVASARASGAARFLTNDRRLQCWDDPSLVILEDVQ